MDIRFLWVLATYVGFIQTRAMFQKNFFTNLFFKMSIYIYIYATLKKTIFLHKPQRSALNLIYIISNAFNTQNLLETTVKNEKFHRNKM